MGEGKKGGVKQGNMNARGKSVPDRVRMQFCSI